MEYPFHSSATRCAVLMILRKKVESGGVTSQQAELVMGRGYHMLSRLVTRQFLKFCNDKIGLCPARHRDYTTADKEESENCWIKDVFLVKLAKLVTGLFLL